MKELIEAKDKRGGTTIDIGNVGSKSQAEKIKKAVDGESHYDFKVDYGSMMGNYPVTVWTKSSDKKGAMEMLIYVLATEM